MYPDILNREAAKAHLRSSLATYLAVCGPVVDADSVTADLVCGCDGEVAVYVSLSRGDFQVASESL